MHWTSGLLAALSTFGAPQSGRPSNRVRSSSVNLLGMSTCWDNNGIPRETRVAILEDDRLVELLVDRPDTRRSVGDIYLGTVDAVLPGIQAAFVNIGAEKSAFLHASDLIESEDEDEPRDPDDEHDNGNGGSNGGTASGGGGGGGRSRRRLPN